MDKLDKNFYEMLNNDDSLALQFFRDRFLDDFANQVILLRHEKDLTQGDLAKLVGTSRPKISMVENGNGNPSLDTLTRIANALGYVMTKTKLVPLTEHLASHKPKETSNIITYKVKYSEFEHNQTAPYKGNCESSTESNGHYNPPIDAQNIQALA